MARGSQVENNAATTAQANSNQTFGNASGLYSSLAPQLMTEAAHPAGLDPTDLAAMDTAGQQSAGGGVAAATGQGSVLAARTRNAGGADAAIAESTRTAGRNLGETAVETRGKNAGVKESQHQAALSGLEGLNSTELGSSAAMLGNVAPNVNADTQRRSQSWDWAKYLLAPALGASSSAYAGR